ncbi:hypothetical protein DV515_00002401 [Chloebia gouldiae]|uniref:Uncharacterized protein n=1 Tax=Chloebia gouldiae TaxID=44316 RepID=A0A3L8SW44_CHLGU|nr:hypothetical protein DV515_00002401 [Chloebia gouldiae]
MKGLCGGKKSLASLTITAEGLISPGADYQQNEISTQLMAHRWSPSGPSVASQWPVSGVPELSTFTLYWNVECDLGTYKVDSVVPHAGSSKVMESLKEIAWILK